MKFFSIIVLPFAINSPLDWIQVKKNSIVMANSRSGYIGLYRRCVKKEGYAFVYSRDCKTLVQCNLVRIVSFKEEKQGRWRWMRR